MLAQTISNMSGKSLKKSIDIETFLPNYFGDGTKTKEKSLEQQKKDKAIFKNKLLAAKKLTERGRS